MKHRIRAVVLGTLTSCSLLAGTAPNAAGEINAPDEISATKAWPTPGIYPAKSKGVCALGGKQTSFAWFPNPRLTAPAKMDTLNADGTVTVMGQRRIEGIADIRIFTPQCLATAPSATVELQTKVCGKIPGPFRCDWKTLDAADYEDLPLNGSRVSHILSGNARPGEHSYRVVVFVGQLKELDGEEGPESANNPKKKKYRKNAGTSNAPGALGSMERQEVWFSAKNVKLSG